MYNKIQVLKKILSNGLLIFIIIILLWNCIPRPFSWITGINASSIDSIKHVDAESSIVSKDSFMNEFDGWYIPYHRRDLGSAAWRRYNVYDKDNNLLFGMIVPLSGLILVSKGRSAEISAENKFIPTPYVSLTSYLIEGNEGYIIGLIAAIILIIILLIRTIPFFETTIYRRIITNRKLMIIIIVSITVLFILFAPVLRVVLYNSEADELMNDPFYCSTGQYFYMSIKSVFDSNDDICLIGTIF